MTLEYARKRPNKSKNTFTKRSHIEKHEIHIYICVVCVTVRECAETNRRTRTQNTHSENMKQNFKRNKTPNAKDQVKAL